LARLADGGDDEVHCEKSGCGRAGGEQDAADEERLEQAGARASLRFHGRCLSVCGAHSELSFD